ncbi:hypothetical protein [Streptacidiphilus fuscans]|uniref:Uncharacterized protein n=1 Tax=Streptacidiphilus fuscans TaxID=2789292 RepID=A0A931B113_9ACTN|nr:hypothetical protein [Streptacidiphilus fuscans]MBF9066717.1 hypothetical protein [Streptacidiphilus fuscans]
MIRWKGRRATAGGTKDEPKSPHPSVAWAKALIAAAEPGGERGWADPPATDEPFSTVTVDARPYAVMRLPSSEEGYRRWLAVEPTTGAWATICKVFDTPQLSAQGRHPHNSDRIVDPSLVPQDDPVRRWLAADPETVPAPLPVEIGTVDQLQRFCAAEILRTDDPTRSARPELRPLPSLAHESPAHAGLLQLPERELHPDLLPYLVLWWDRWDADVPLGRRVNRPQLSAQELRAFRDRRNRDRFLTDAEALGRRTLPDAPPPQSA